MVEIELVEGGFRNDVKPARNNEDEAGTWCEERPTDEHDTEGRGPRILSTRRPLAFPLLKPVFFLRPPRQIDQAQRKRPDLELVRKRLCLASVRLSTGQQIDTFMMLSHADDETGLHHVALPRGNRYRFATG